MELLNLLSIASLIVGAFFFLAGTVGLLRFPDTHSRLHALSKADNLGLGFVVLGLCLQEQAWLGAVKLLLIWFLALVASAATCFLIANWSAENENLDRHI